MNIISKLLFLSNKIDYKLPKLADKLEKFAANAIDMYVPQSRLEKGWENSGGGSINGSLGGFHTRMQLSENPNFDPLAITEATKLVGELGNELPELGQWQRSHHNLTADPAQVHNILQVWKPFYLAGIQDVGQLQSILGMSGPIDLQFATNSPSAAHKSWGISSSDILEHERAHASGKTSSPQEYMQHAVPGADFMETSGVGGNINPVAGYYQELMNQFMAGQSETEYGPNLPIWKRIVKERAPKI